jgi:hypothetical protein
MYFIRLAKLKPEVDKVAAEAWDGFSVRIFLQRYHGGQPGQHRAIVFHCSKIKSNNHIIRAISWIDGADE